MKKIYYLSTCDSNKRILKELNLSKEFVKQEIKENPVNEKELEKLYTYIDKYENLVNKRSRLFTTRKLGHKSLTEMDFKNLILEHYTFLKRPILINDDQIFIGNSRNVIAAALESLK
ncbi:hypothetical protein OAP72_00955 [Flavobacteriaceae bacterium]|jgi:arsenate reductase-like glutaredoxin family protein|nr:hypothetical protein [Flavobacteriaceae bacterium]MDA9907935.1 hypothetical protein [Flavobacteriaceae bacterium]MDC0857900.1 hypothetical protein [Flavobacteriaceae bacterium]